MENQKKIHGQSTEQLLFITFAIILAVMSVAKYQSLHSTFFDLGISLNYLNNIWHEKWWLILAGHVQPILLLWSWVFNALPQEFAPIVLLTVQAAALAWPISFLYREYGLVSAFAYFIYFPVWYNALFDFHIDHLAVPILFGFYLFDRRGKYQAAFLTGLFLILLNEKFALQTAACGVYLSFVRKLHLKGLILILVGCASFVITTHFIAPFVAIGPQSNLGTAGPIAPNFGWLGNNLGEIILFILTNPHTILIEIFTNKQKLLYLIYLFGALGFISLLRPNLLLPLIPILLISLLSKNPSHHLYNSHYTAGLIAPLIIAFSEALPRAKFIWEKIKIPIFLFNFLLLTGLMSIHILLSPSPISRHFLIPSSWHYSPEAYITTERDKWIKKALETHISLNHRTTISTQNSLNWHILARGGEYLPFPLGVDKPLKIFKDSDRTFSHFLKFIISQKIPSTEIENIWADYIIIDLKRPWFNIDVSCSWELDTKLCKNSAMADNFIELVEKVSLSHETVFKKDGFLILKRKVVSN